MADLYDGVGRWRQFLAEIGKVSEIVVAVLSRTQATFVTGEVLHVDGGEHAGKW